MNLKDNTFCFQYILHCKSFKITNRFVLVYQIILLSMTERRQLVKQDRFTTVWSKQPLTRQATTVKSHLICQATLC